MHNDYGLYFLDINLSHKLNGIQLASKIRELEPSSHIVFITSYAELSHLTFRYKIGAMDYITKASHEEVAQRVQECIDTAYSRHLGVSASSKSGGFAVPIGDVIRVIPLSEIMFFEAHPSAPHMLILHRDNSQLEFRSSLNKVEGTVQGFCRCHRSYLVNLDNIKSIDTSRRTAEMINGESVLVATRKVKDLMNFLKSDPG
jgi:two-component system response regulator AgrA